MRAVVQRVSAAAVRVIGELAGEIGAGVLVLVGVYEDDTERDAEILAGKVARLRIFADGEGRMNLSLLDTGGGALAVPNFTLCADASRGNRPSYSAAMEPDRARRLFECFVRGLAECGVKRVATGVFGADMSISAELSGPVTITLDSAVWRK